MISTPRPNTRRLILATLAAALSPWCLAAQHQWGEYQVTVAPESASLLSEADYQVTVANDELLLSRLTAPAAGTLSNSFVADLNRDGAFEVVVTFSRPEGEPADVHVYSWKNNLLERVRLAGLDAAQREGYRGNDEFAVRDGKLVRIFQVYAHKGDAWEPTAARKELRYSFEQGRWTAE